MDLIIQRGVVKELKEFPQYSICLDGSASGGTKFDIENNRYNFDHHSNCLRFATCSTTFQVYCAIMLGFKPDNVYKIYLNDCDLDSIMAYWLFMHQDRLPEPIVKKLVDAINISDMYLGAIPLVNGISKVVNYISSPEVESKKNDDYSKISPEGLLSIVESVCLRINAYVDGELNIENIKPHKHGEMKIIRDDKGYVVVESADTHITSYLYSVGYDRIVRCFKQKDETLSVTITKRSDFISNFPIEDIMKNLNLEEPGWGGGSSVIGSPRNKDGSRSKLSIDKIIEVIDKCIDS